MISRNSRSVYHHSTDSTSGESVTARAANSTIFQVAPPGGSRVRHLKLGLSVLTVKETLNGEHAAQKKASGNANEECGEPSAP